MEYIYQLEYRASSVAKDAVYRFRFIA